MASYLVHQDVTAQDVNGDSNNHLKGAILSDWELSDHIKSQIRNGSPWFVSIFEPLTDTEARIHRERATSKAGPRVAKDGEVIEPPFPDYIGLHPNDIVARMRDMTAIDAGKVRKFEEAGARREIIVNYIAPSEREPFTNYDALDEKAIIEKMQLLDDASRQSIIVYEMTHRKRTNILEFNASVDPGEVNNTSDQGEVDSQKDQTDDPDAGLKIQASSSD